MVYHQDMIFLYDVSPTNGHLQLINIYLPLMNPVKGMVAVLYAFTIHNTNLQSFTNPSTGTPHTLP